MKNISEILTEIGFDTENQKKLEEAIKALIDEKVELKVEEKKLEFEKELTEVKENEFNEKVEEHKVKLTEAAEQWQKDFEAETIDTLDGFLDSEINENISDKALEKIAINETLEPIVNGIKKLYEENHIELDSEGSKMLKEQAAQIEKLNEDNANLINEKMELNKLTEKSAKKLRLIEATNGLDEDTIKKVEMFFESKGFDEVEDKVESYVQMLVEESNEADNKKGKEEKDDSLNENVENEDNLIDTDVKKPRNNSIDRATNLL